MNGDRHTAAELPLRFKVARGIGHMSWIARGRQRLVRALVDPDRLGPTPFTTSFFGKTYRGDLSYLLDWSVYMFGAYARHELIVLADVAGALRGQGGEVSFYDVGANVGQHALFMSAHAGRVLAFEPFETARARLQCKIDDNDVRNIEVFALGLGASNGARVFHVPTTNNIGKGSFERTVAADEVRVLVRRGDDLIAERQLPRMDILKVDVEGFEASVFEGLQETFARDRPVILTEISGDDRSGFGSLEGFKTRVYRDARLFEVSNAGEGYRIHPARFESSGELLIVPAEKLKQLAACGGLKALADAQ